MARKLYIPEIITKEIEIEILEKLWENDTYFSDYFSEDDLNTMRQNIMNDFPLLTGTSIDSKYEMVKTNSSQMAKELDEKNAQLQTRANTISELDAIAQDQRKKFEKLAVAMLRKDPNNELVYELMGSLEIIGLKIKQRITMVDRDDEYFRKRFSK